MNYQKEFYNIYNKLKEDTQYLSYHDDRNIYFKELISLGDRIIPLLLNNLYDSWWAIVALNKLTDHAVDIPKEDRGYFDLVSEAWLNWGKTEGYI